MPPAMKKVPLVRLVLYGVTGAPEGMVEALVNEAASRSSLNTGSLAGVNEFVIHSVYKVRHH